MIPEQNKYHHTKHYKLKVNGIRLFCRVLGDGQALVFLHGYGESHRIFKKWLNFFKVNYKSILIDSRGHGLSTRNVKNISIELMANDVVDALKELGVKKADVIGFSDGGNICLELGINYSESINKLVIISANASFKDLVRYFRFGFKAYQYVLSILHKLNIVDMFEYNKTKLITDSPNYSSLDLAKIKAPTLLLFAEYDLIDKSHIQYLHNSIKNSKLHIVENTTHFSIIKKMNKYIQLINNFLKSGKLYDNE